MELCKILLSGWSAFGFLFLLLFYSPLSEALSSIPDKVKSSNEIEVLGVSLKSTIKTVAASQGLEKLAETIPNLSSTAIELLLRAPQRAESLVSFTNADNRQTYSAINFPSKQAIKALSELQKRGLVELNGGFGQYKSMNDVELEQMSLELRNKFPGSANSSPGDYEISWELNSPIPDRTESLPQLTWTLTEPGKQAVDVIFEAVSRELVQADDAKND